MVGRWRNDLNVGRREMREALDGRRSILNERGVRPRPPAVVGVSRDEPFINVQLYDDAIDREGGNNIAAVTAENERLRGLLAEAHELATMALARVAELECHSNHMIEVLELPGVRDMLQKMTHPDLATSDEERHARHEVCAKINGVYEWIKRTKAAKAQEAGS